MNFWEISKNLLRIIFYISVVVVTLFAIKNQKEKLVAKNKKEIVSFNNEWAKYGKPVYVKNITTESFSQNLKISGKIYDKKNIVSYLPLDMKRQIKRGQIFFVVHQDEKYFGKVGAIANFVDYKTGLYRLDLNLNKSLNLANETILNCSVTVSSKSNIRIPVELVDSDETGDFVWVINDEKVANKKYLKLGESDGINIEVKKGLLVGDKLILEGSFMLKKDDKVDVVKEF